MFKRPHIEKMLRVNGIEPTASDEVIKSVLLSAQWHEDDVEAAILVLRENINDHQTRVDSLHKVFRSDDRLRPETISSLLGIEMGVTSAEIAVRRNRARGEMTPALMAQIALGSLILSLIFVLSSMWYLQMGFFQAGLL